MISIHRCKKGHIATFIECKLPISQSLFSACDDVCITHTQTPYAICAYAEGKIVGVFKYRTGHKTLVAAGTAVARKYRRSGIARKLWAAAIRHLKPKKVVVYVVSKEGKRFAEKMAKEYPDIAFSIRE